jgi:hypothetical protein
MKFEEFYNQVFIAEAGDDVATKVASPEDVEVEPLPLPEPSAPAIPGEEGTEPSVTGGGTIGEYISKIQDFTKILQSDEGDCLNKLVKRLDRPSTPYTGIDGKVTADLVRVVEGLKSIEANLINYSIASVAGGNA